MGSGMKTKALLTSLVIAMLLAGCEKARLDQEVDRLCRIDGGIKVYEKVKLSKEHFDKYGWPIWRSKDNRYYYANDQYFTESEDTMIVTGNPDLIRMESRIIRASDNTLFGRSISYTRRGGDIPNPFHPSHYTCPREEERRYLVKEVLIKDSEQ